MKFNLKLFVLVGVFVGLCDVWGTENKDDGFIVEKLTDEQKNELNEAMKERRVIRAVYGTKVRRFVGIIDVGFRKKLSSIVVWDGNEGKTLKPETFVGNFQKLFLKMNPNVEYTVYFVFNSGDIDTTKNMFLLCGFLINADFTYFDTENVTDMSMMFRNCTALKELNLSSFNTQNVKNMSDMFSNCTSLTELDLSKFDTTKVTDMSSMFYNCSSLTKLDLSKFNTTKVINMSYMFRNCTALKELNLGNCVFSHGCKMENIFTGCNFDNLCLPNTRKRCWCCGDRYVDLKGNVVVKLNQNNVEFEVVKDDPVSNEEVELV